MSMEARAIVSDFFEALSAGDLPDAMFTADFTAWTTTNGASDGKRYRGGAAMLARAFPDGYAYAVDHVTAQADRIFAEVRGAGVLGNGDPFANRYVFIFVVQNGRIASIAEHFDPRPVLTMLIPVLMQAASGSADAEPADATL